MIALEHQITNGGRPIRLVHGTALEHQLGSGDGRVGARLGIENRMRQAMEGCVYLGDYVPDGSLVDEYFNRAGYPVPMPNEWWPNHMHLLGGTRMGKTSRVLHPLTAQKIRQNIGPVVIADMKGDPVMFHGLRQIAEQEGRPFKWFTNVPYFSTYLFNPWDQEALQILPLNQFIQINMNALDLWFGNDYGRGHFSAVSRRAVARLFKLRTTGGRRGNRKWQPTAESNKITSFAQAYELLKEHKDRPEFKDAQQLLTVFEELAGIMQINFHSDGQTLPKAAIDNAIKVSHLLTPNEFGKWPVDYFYMRASSELVGVSQVIKLFIYCAFTAQVQARDFYTLGRKATPAPNEIFLAIDEFGNLADDSFRNLLEQAGGYGLHFCLANQDLSQLRKGKVDLTETVFENCGSKLYFSIRDTDLQDRLIKMSGETTVHVPSYQISHDSFRAGKVGPEHALASLNGKWSPITITEQRAPRFDRNTLIEVSNHPSRCIYVPPQGGSGVDFGGYPIILDCPHHITKDEFDRLNTLSWPEPTAETIVPEDLVASSTAAPKREVAVKKPKPTKRTTPRKRIADTETKATDKQPTNPTAPSNGKDKA